MADEDPFAEPGDTERTVIRPNPGGRRQPAQQPAMAPQPAAPPPDPLTQGIPSEAQATPEAPETFGLPDGASRQPKQRSDAPEASIDLAMTGMNRLNASAATLFALVSRIRNRAQHMDPDALRKSVVAEIRAFENRALQASVDAQTVKIARYAISATLDDVVLNTPWGGESVWAMQSMVGTFHRETVGGDRFYDLLARLEKDPGNNIDILEFLYMCLSLGFEGRLRVEHGGSDRHMQIREGLARVIRGQRGDVERDLSPNWEGVDKPHRPVSAWKPLWISIAAVSSILAITFGTYTYLLSNQTERLLGQLSTIDNGAIPQLAREVPFTPPPPPPPPPPPDRPATAEVISGFLSEEISSGLVKVFDQINTITVRIAGAGMFGSGSDQLKPEFVDAINHVGRSLNDQPGPIRITGHSDNIPIRSSRFASNMELSLARAESVRRKIALLLNDPSRLLVEGRADKEPIASNATREGRAANRRIEIVIVKVPQ